MNLKVTNHKRDITNLKQEIEAIVKIQIDDIENLHTGDEFFINSMIYDKNILVQLNLCKKIYNKQAYDLLIEERQKNKELQQKIKDIKDKLNNL